MAKKVTVTSQAKKLMTLQVSVAILTALGFYLYQYNALAAAGAGFGGFIAMFIGFMLQADVSKAEEKAARDPKSSLKTLYLGAVQRFFAVIAGFALGIVFLELPPLPMCVGFALAQLCYMVLARRNDADTDQGGTTG